VARPPWIGLNYARGSSIGQARASVNALGGAPPRRPPGLAQTTDSGATHRPVRADS
jgi:hypothetical protein